MGIFRQPPMPQAGVKLAPALTAVAEDNPPFGVPNPSLSLVIRSWEPPPPLPQLQTKRTPDSIDSPPPYAPPRVFLEWWAVPPPAAMPVKLISPADAPPPYSPALILGIITTWHETVGPQVFRRRIVPVGFQVAWADDAQTMISGGAESMYKKNAGGQHLGFRMVKTVDGTVDPDATVTVRVSIDGAAQLAGAGTVTNLGNGQYDYAPSQPDTNGNQISFLFTAPGDVAVEKTIVTDGTAPALVLSSAYDFAKGTAAMAETYAAKGTVPSPVQALLLMLQRLTEFGLSGTTITIKKIDRETTAATLKLDSDTTPTSSTRDS